MAHAPKDVITAETDARFWAQTNYKPGKRLDPNDPADKAMARVWLDIFTKVKKEDARGRLVLTYNHPEVEQGIADAALAGHAADSHVDAAMGASDPAETEAHATAAAAAAASERAGSRRAARAQPPTVSPILTDAAAARAAAATPGAPAPDPRGATDGLPADHPAVTSPAAAPAIAPSLEDVAPPAPSVPSGPPGPGGGGAPRRHVDAARAARARGAAAQTHEDGEGRVALGTLHPQTISEIRAVAGQMAGGSPGIFVGVIYGVDESWAAPIFGTGAEAAAWYEHATSLPSSFRYAAYFDKTPGTGLRGPAAELFGGSRAIAPIARSEVQRAVADSGYPANPGPPEGSSRKKGPPYLAIAAGGAAIVGLAAILASARHRERSQTRRTAQTRTPQVQIFEVGKR